MHRLLLVFGLYTFCAGVASAQAPVVTAAVTTAAAPVACGSLPPLQTNIPSSSAAVWFDFTYTGGTAGDTFQIQWYEPNGTLYATSTFMQQGTGGNWCFNYTIPILGKAAAGLPGNWTVNLVWNGNQIYSLPFTIGAQPPLSDNFTQDSSLNTALWSTNTSLLRSFAASFPVTFETPNLSFSGSGMTMSGITGTNQYTGIQSIQSFTPPFSAQVNVTGTVAHGDAFYIQLISSDLSEYLNILGNLNPNNGSNYGINLNADGDTSVLYATPAVNISYTIAISVGVAGNATVTLSNSAGTVLATQNGLAIGTDVLYLVLSQFEGTPVTVGVDTAIWQQASVTPPAPPSAHPAFFNGEVSLGSGVYYLQFPDNSLFGYYNYVAPSIFYHYDMGYEAYIPSTSGQIYFYDFTSEHWWYTSATLFPYIYDFTLGTFIYYFPANNNPGHYSSNPRVFSNLTTDKIFSM